MSDLHDARLALIPFLAGNTSSGHIGRTALMKYMYFLQTLRHVPLGYRFTLYSYGPFDSEVLADLASAETLGAVESEAVLYPGGYGYQIRPGNKANWLQRRAADFLKRNKLNVRWVTERFGSFTSAQLELVSTIIYADREAAHKKEKLQLKDIVHRVHEIKPHFSNAKILSYAEALKQDRLLTVAR